MGLVHTPVNLACMLFAVVLLQGRASVDAFKEADAGMASACSWVASACSGVAFHAAPISLGLWWGGAMGKYLVEKEIDEEVDKAVRRAADVDGDGEIDEDEVARFRQKGGDRQKGLLRRMCCRLKMEDTAQWLSLVWQLVPLGVGMCLSKATEYTNAAMLFTCTEGGDLVRETGLRRAAQIARAANNHFLLLTLLVVTTSPGALEP